ncbi:hypothetical protein [Streptomyces sp. S.PNR 29]|uniref:hypothetical protein n=1 Tax=Streptomyces sp. S.PNR 29 TaxID=2973805 RepID=UPI0025AF59E7|nr:hypothetical protein [Streptomyces sp. S.PNR 29]MDN0200458.1 hypothetical protein [Streptomyces sp. S.PNR 29]
MLERTRTAERYARGFAASVVAVTALVLAANAGPARATDRPTDQSRQLTAPTSSAPHAPRPAP